MALKGIIHPLYVYPQKWDESLAKNISNWPESVLNAQAALSGQQEYMVIINPNNGESELNAAWLEEMQRLRAQSPATVLLGYVHMLRAGVSSAVRSMDAIKADIKRYQGFIPAGSSGGIFLDEAEDSVQAKEYVLLYKFIRECFGADTKIIANCPGTLNARGGADVAVVFENSFAQWLCTALCPSQGAKSTAALIHSCATEAEMRQAIKQAEVQGYDYVCVNNGVMPNAWGNVPRYMAAELAAVKRS